MTFQTTINNDDVMLAIDNTLKFLSVACETKPIVDSSLSSVNLPEIKPSPLNAAVFRRRHSDVKGVRRGSQGLSSSRPVSLASRDGKKRDPGNDVGGAPVCSFRLTN